MVVLVTGASGQLGQALKYIASDHNDMVFHFASSADANITNKRQLEEVFAKVAPDFCINAAAYTAVDKAESEREIAKLINVDGARNLAEVCKEFDTTLIHISTDFVFDGTQESPYVESDQTNPQSVYGQTKRDGEVAIMETWEKHIIIRTSWLYSQFGNNFMKTMLRLATDRDKISVVNDQIGTPTNAVDLAAAILEIIVRISNQDLNSKFQISNSKFRIPNSKSSAQHPEPNTQHPAPNTLNPAPNTIHPFGIYHFSNQGECSWYDFAKKIFTIRKIEIELRPIPTSEFPTAAKRPAYSVLSKEKIIDSYTLNIRRWEVALADALKI